MVVVGRVVVVVRRVVCKLYRYKIFCLQNLDPQKLTVVVGLGVVFGGRYSCDGVVLRVVVVVRVVVGTR